MGTDTITWPPEFADFKKLDATLKCGICYDYMTNSMMTSCAHNFCSLCIRKFLQYKNQCPTCFHTVFDVQLRNNRPLDEIIIIYIKLRDKLLRTLRIASVPIPSKEEPSEVKTPKSEKPQEIVTPVKNVSVELFKNEKKKSTPPTTSKDDIIVNGIKIPGIFNPPKVFPKPRKPGEFIQCPVCQVDVPTKNINLHLDSCLAIDNNAKPKKSNEKRDPLPKRLYHMMPDKSLKNVMRIYGLSTQGDRKVLLARIQRFTVIYNAENDSPNPRTIPELVQQVEREEREERKPNTFMKSFTGSKVTVNRHDKPETIEEANKAYREENKDSFKKLIEAVRQREGRPLNRKNRINSDDEGEPAAEGQNVETAWSGEEFDPNRPSTSKLGQSPEEEASLEYSIYSQATVCDSDSESESDIFVNGEEKPKKIDWKRTKISLSDDEELAENKEISGVDCLEDVGKSKQEPAVKNDEKQTNGEEINIDGCSVIIDVESDDSSIDSIFNSSKVSAGSISPMKTRLKRKQEGTPKNDGSPDKEKTPSAKSRKRRMKSKSPGCTVKLQDVFDRCFEQYSGDKVDDNLTSPEISDDSSMIQNLLERASEPDYKTPKRLTRQRAAQSEVKPARKSLSTRKRLKRDLSPEF
ncbi:E3 ubiquitin-protein ligase RAD18-like [Cimex lectularius]|uniref:RING-type E3 ubiquitin transferase n=1 Tax=Cimex lectularius TaxID=79782 RepID=A0A8I6RRG4_CIMLE|nr:E3 ubiquitin-protein ligase RAD18-like [Cimex lectularius]